MVTSSHAPGEARQFGTSAVDGAASRTESAYFKAEQAAVHTARHRWGSVDQKS
jgi:hypothetical protein